MAVWKLNYLQPLEGGSQPGKQAHVQSRGEPWSLLAWLPGHTWASAGRCVAVEKDCLPVNPGAGTEEGKLLQASRPPTAQPMFPQRNSSP